MGSQTQTFSYTPRPVAVIVRTARIGLTYTNCIAHRRRRSATRLSKVQCEAPQKSGSGNGRCTSTPFSLSGTPTAAPFGALTQPV